MPSSGAAHPNRPYYTPSEDNATFVASAPRFSANTSAHTNAATQRSIASSPGNVHLPPASNRYSSSSSFEEIGPDRASYSNQLVDATRALCLSAAFQYTSTCLAMPFEVGKLLLQIQWVPKDEVWIAFGEMEREDEMKQMAGRRPQRVGGRQRPIGRNEWNEGEENDEDLDSAPLDPGRSEREDWLDDDEDDEEESAREFGGEMDELSDEDEAEAYFRDLSNSSSRPLNLSRASGKKRQKQTDSYGYVMRKSIHEDGTRPEFVMPVVVRGGVWEMIKAVGRGKEGWLGLWKGECAGRDSGEEGG